MTRVRLSIDVDPELRQRVKIIAAVKNQSVKEWIEGVIRQALVLEARSDEDLAWLEGDLSRLGQFEPYEWEEGELEEGQAVSYEPGVGAVVEGGKRRDGR